MLSNICERYVEKKKEVPHLIIKLIINHHNYRRGLYLGAPYTPEISVAIIHEM